MRALGARIPDGLRLPVLVYADGSITEWPSSDDDEGAYNVARAQRPTELADQYMRIAPHFEVAAGRCAWLGESLFLGRGRLTGSNAIAYGIYRVR